jgi:predicted dehydrogenase
MGKRRVRNLHALGHRSIVGVDIRDDRRAEARERYGIEVTRDLDAALGGADAAVVSLPPDLHVATATAAVRAGVPVFCEASVTDDGLAELEVLARERGVLVFPSCTMRYFPAPRRIRALVASGGLGRPLFFTYHSGQYLPDWHPWERITDYYVSKPATGGCREIVPFELTWLTWVFGDVTEVSGHVGQSGELGIPLDDRYHAELGFADGVRGALTVDVLSRPAVRAMRLVFTAGTLRWEDGRIFTSDGAAGWREHTIEAGTRESGYINPEEPYQQELAEFVACVERAVTPEYDLCADRRVLATLYAIERSHRTGWRLTRVGEAWPT